MEWVTCSCCGKDIPDDEEHNVEFETELQDAGYGICGPCVERSWRTYAEARLPILREALNEENRARFDALTKEKQLVIVMKMAERGAFSW